MNIVAIVLTHNEEKHLERCLESLKKVASKVVVVDSFSSDGTLKIARNYGALVLEHKWVNYASQFNWALEQINYDSEWIFRIDADEYLTDELIQELNVLVPTLSPDVKGVYCNRTMIFQGRRIRYGGLYPARVLRLFKRGFGHCENRWMDEHIKVSGITSNAKGEIVDENLNTLTWWTEKHNQYANREAIDLVNLEYNFMPIDSVASISFTNQVGIKRWIKERVYSKMPIGYRAFLYFLYRFIYKLGFMDGREGRMFHFLQGFWYRYLVDSKVFEVKKYIEKNNVDVKTAIREVFKIQL